DGHRLLSGRNVLCDGLRESAPCSQTRQCQRSQRGHCARFGFSGANICLVVNPASKATLNMQTIISSKLCWPQITVFDGSGFSGLFFELSKCSVHSSFVPFGSFIGSARSYQSCQCQLYRGTFSSVSVLPSAKTMRYSADLPRMCI